MLVYILKRLDYESVKEQVIFERKKCKTEDPVAGFYDPTERLVYLCEPIMIEVAERLQNLLITNYKI